MSPGHEQQIELLFLLVGLLFTIIIGVIIYAGVRASRRTRPVPPEVTHATKPDLLPPGERTAEQEKVLAHVDSTGNVVSDLEATLPPAAPAVEADVDLKVALKKTEENLFGRIRSLFKSGPTPQLEEIEEVLYTSDLGPKTVQRLMGAVEDRLSRKEKGDYETVRTALKEEIRNIFADSHSAAADENILAKIKFAAEGPTVLMIVGVNGAGKTTSIGKISAQLAKEGKKVLVAAGDTFRAAAGGQLKVWTDRAAVEIFSPEGVTDPSAVAFDAVSKGKAQGYDVVIVDTAGRLHTQANLMEEIKKMKRVMGKVIPEAPHETLIVLDANSGQNALMQAKEFHTALELTGAVLTKMDGTAKGGVAVGLAQELQIPIKLIGVGERIQDLRPFSSQEFVDSLFQ